MTAGAVKLTHKLPFIEINKKIINTISAKDARDSCCHSLTIAEQLFSILLLFMLFELIKIYCITITTDKESHEQQKRIRVFTK